MSTIALCRCPGGMGARVLMENGHWAQHQTEPTAWRTQNKERKTNHDIKTPPWFSIYFHWMLPRSKEMQSFQRWQKQKIIFLYQTSRLLLIGWLCLLWFLFWTKFRSRVNVSHVDTAWLCLTCPTLESSISLDQMPRRRLIGCSPLMSTRSQVSQTTLPLMHTLAHIQMLRYAQMGGKILTEWRGQIHGQRDQTRCQHIRKTILSVSSLRGAAQSGSRGVFLPNLIELFKARL